MQLPCMALFLVCFVKKEIAHQEKLAKIALEEDNQPY